MVMDGNFDPEMFDPLHDDNHHFDVDTCALSPLEPHTHLMEFQDGRILDVHSGLIHEPGMAGCFHEYMAQPDPLTNLSSFTFPAMTFPGHEGLVVDLNHDGIADQTAWGTPVEYIDSYVRADGTVVQGHYRTVADGFAGNNLSNFK